VNRRERIVEHQLTPGLLVATRLGMGEPGLDVLARGAAGIAWGQQIDVDRTALANRPRAGVPMHQIRELSQILTQVPHTLAAGRLARFGLGAAIVLGLRTFTI
jgi:hypothetical protein